MLSLQVRSIGLIHLAQRIHIVDDDQAIRESLQLFLETHGFVVETFGSGAELFRDGLVPHCDCFILDVNLPGDNGFSLLAKLRREGINAPAIFMSGRATPAMHKQAGAAKAAAFFEKPVPPRELLSAIAAATK
jgi:two-component system, LuxR family, response regulator FixJ